MSRRSADPANLPLFDFGSAGCAARAVPVASHFIEPTARPKVTELDRRLIEMWLHGKSIHTQRAYQRAADRFLEVVAKPLSNVTLGDFQRFTDTLTGKASSRAQVIASVTALLSFGWRLGVLRANVGLALSRIDAPDRLAIGFCPRRRLRGCLSIATGETTCWFGFYTPAVSACQSC